MAYPWPSFGSFTFQADEKPPIEGGDTGWVVGITSSSNRALGAISDSITVLAIGSRTRQIMIYMAADRLAALQALVGTIDAFCDWTRPTPDARQAFLNSVEQEVDILKTTNFRGLNTSNERRRVRIALTSQ